MATKLRLVTLIPIRNMNRALKFYTRAVGAKMGDRGRGAMRNFWASIRIGDSDVWLIAPEKQEKRKLAYSTFLTRDIKGLVRRLQKNGVKFLRAERASPETRVEGVIAFEPFGASAFFKDTEGNLLMVWENSPPM